MSESSPKSDGQIQVEVRFGKSNSSNYRSAVRLAKQFEGYSESGEGKTLQHQVKWDLEFDDDRTWEELRRLGGIVGGWKSSSFEIDGTEFSSMWQIDREIGEVRQCYVKHKESMIGDAHCLGKEAPDDEPGYFGCRFLHSITHPEAHGYHRGQKWYQFGELSEDRKSFHTDKAVILSLLKSNTKDHVCTQCPCFSWETVAREVAELPDKIEFGDDSAFEIKFSDINPNNALGVQPKPRPLSYGVSVSFGVDRDDDGGDQLGRNIPAVRYSDVAAQDEALDEIRNIVELPLTHPEYFLEMGIEPQQGIILHGTPGNGKTLIAKAVATESKAHLETINGPEIRSKWFGGSEKNLREAFARARKLQPSVVLIDELDAIAPRRNEMQNQHDVSLISQLLVSMDGLESRGRVAVIGTTNRIDTIDPAIRRPGRFDYHIRIAEPNREGRTAILKVHLGKMKIADEIDIPDVAEKLHGFSGAEIAGLCREAGLVAIRRALKTGQAATEVHLTKSDLLTGLVRIRAKRVPENGESI